MIKRRVFKGHGTRCAKLFIKGGLSYFPFYNKVKINIGMARNCGLKLGNIYSVALHGKRKREKNKEKIIIIYFWRKKEGWITRQWKS